MSMVAGVLITYILSARSGLEFPNNYAVLFVLSGSGTALAVMTFGMIREPIEKRTRAQLSLKNYLLSGLSLMKR